MLVLIGLWAGRRSASASIVYLAALQDIPRELVEAASIDGARRWGVFRHVVLPALGPVTVFLLRLADVESLQLFDLVYVTTRGGPLQSTTVVVYYVCQQAFRVLPTPATARPRPTCWRSGCLVRRRSRGARYQRRREARLA